MTEPTWLAPAWAEFGQHERTGADTNPDIIRMFAEVGHPEVTSDETAWCAAFVGAMLERAGVPSTRSLLARSYLTWGDPIADPRHGAIAVFARGGSSTQGHVGFCLGESADGLSILGGNQSDAVTIAVLPRTHLLSLRWPRASDMRTPAPPPPTTTPLPPVTSQATTFDVCLAHVLAQEGGWTDDPYDSGGPTNFGITLADYVAATGVELTADNCAELTAALKSITPVQVRTIYDHLYWTPSRAGLLPPALALMHLDAAVNMGVATAARMLQQALAVDADGDIGPITLTAATNRPASAVLARYADLRRARYRTMATFWRFGRGWLARVDRTLAAARALVPPPSTTEGDKTMPDVDPTPAASTPKWWVSSLTVWGTIITTASTVLPVVGPLIGISVSAETIHALGDGVVQVAQAVGGVAGILMTIYGRSRASGPLERRQVTLQL